MGIFGKAERLEPVPSCGVDRGAGKRSLVMESGVFLLPQIPQSQSPIRLGLRIPTETSCRGWSYVTFFKAIYDCMGFIRQCSSGEVAGGDRDGCCKRDALQLGRQHGSSNQVPVFDRRELHGLSQL